MARTSLILHQERAVGVILSHWLPRMGLSRPGLSLARQERRVLMMAERRGIEVRLEDASTGRPRRMDYERLAVLLASGATQEEASRELRISRSAISKAWNRRQDLRRIVNRLSHASK